MMRGVSGSGPGLTGSSGGVPGGPGTTPAGGSVLGPGVPGPSPAAPGARTPDHPVRATANARERDRTHSVNSAFIILRQLIPTGAYSVITEIFQRQATIYLF